MNTNVVVFDKSTPGSYPVKFTPGIYKIDVYGAKGYDSTYNGRKGGKGGHTSGKIKFYRNTELFAFVGGAGTAAKTYTSYEGGGFNGGGNGIINGNANNCGGGGGGASDIRLVANNLYTRIIVAGGGGGSTGNSGQNGGYGGGEKAGDGPIKNSYQSFGATQTSPGYSTGDGQSGSFGFGGNVSTTDYSWMGGGGGGWYGGAGGPEHGAGSGGSGFILTTESTNLPQGYIVCLIIIFLLILF